MQTWSSIQRTAIARTAPEPRSLRAIKGDQPSSDSHPHFRSRVAFHKFSGFGPEASGRIVGKPEITARTSREGQLYAMCLSYSLWS